jgi:hypothetical protein
VHRAVNCLLVRVPSNVKKVKEQMFHKCSTNVPISNRNETKNDWVLSRICLIEGDPFYLAQESRFWTKSKQSVFNKRNLKTIQKRFGFDSKTISERLSFPFVFDFTTAITLPFWYFRNRNGYVVPVMSTLAVLVP